MIDVIVTIVLIIIIISLSYALSIMCLRVKQAYREREDLEDLWDLRVLQDVLLTLVKEKALTTVR